MSLKDDISKIVDCEILDDSESLKKYSQDKSIFEITPKVIVFPKNADDLKKLVNFVINSKNILSLTPRSAGTDMSGGAINDSIILDLNKYINKLISINNKVAKVEPGMFYRDFEASTLKQNLLLPTYPASREICTVGGMVANNSGGELELTYGPINKYVKSLKVILSDGNEYTFSPLSQAQLKQKIAQKDFEGKIYAKIFDLISENEKLIQEARPKVSKNSTGYDLWDVWDGENFDLCKLIIGSQGTLGIISQIEFNLINPKKYSVLFVISLPNLSQLDKVVKSVLEHHPESFECFDDQTLNLALNHAFELSSNFKNNNRISAFFDLLSMKLKPIPNLVLLANFTSDNQKEALSAAIAAKNALISYNLKSEIKETASSQEKYWLIRHKSFGLLLKYSSNKKASPFIDDIIVKPEFLPQFLPKLNDIILPYKDRMIYTLAGHIGDGNFHIIPLMDLEKESVRAIIPELMEKVFKLVFEYKGSMSGEHNDGLIRGQYLPQMYGDKVYQLFKKIKEIFDPNNIFNPHKKIDATSNYSLNHMIKNIQ